MKVRLLTEADVEHCYNLFQQKDNDTNKFWSSYWKYFQQSIDRFAFGCFEDGILQSWLLQGFFARKTDGKKYWVISYLCVRNPRPVFSFNAPETGLLVKAAFENAEAHNNFNYFYVVPEKRSLTYEKVWLDQNQTNEWERRGRYELVTYGSVPANTIPDDVFFWRLMGEETKPQDVVIKCRKLKKENIPK